MPGTEMVDLGYYTPLDSFMVKKHRSKDHLKPTCFLHLPAGLRCRDRERGRERESQARGENL